MVTSRRTLAALCVGVLVVLAGCSGGTPLGADGGVGGGEPERQSGGKPASADIELTGGTPDTVEADERTGDIRQRAVVRTGRVELSVEAFGAAERNLTRTVEGYGGFVSDSGVEVDRVDNATYRRGTLVLRVPRENFSAVMEAARAAGEVASTTVDSEDVTDQLVDLAARLENLRAERERLRELYRNASDTEDVLAVEERLSEVQGEIERLEAQQESLERRVSLSTVRVELREPRPTPAPAALDRWYDTPAADALLESVDGVITTLRALGVAGAYALPYLVVFSPPVAGVAYLLRRRRRSEPVDAATDDDDTQDEG